MKINFKLLILPLFVILFFSSCALKQNETSKSNSSLLKQQKNTLEYFHKYFKPWDLEELTYSKLEAMWGYKYRFKNIYLENHKLAEQSWFEKQIENSDFEQYNSLKKKAITLQNTNVRVFPTHSKMFYDPSKAGEGFPFDYNQNSLLKINTPIIVSHLSKDKAWAYIQSSIVGGWVSIKDIAFVDSNFIEKFKSNNYYVATKEKFPIYTPIFREYIKIGTIFPKSKNKYIIATANTNQNAIITYINIINEVEKMPLKFNSQNRLKISKELLNEPYGWGGVLGNRDCSSFTQDFFTPFGKYLHRNSKAQTKNGKYIDISNLNKNEKKDYIKKNAIPFSTLVYLKGHIMLYVGIKNNEPMVMHNMWSVRLKDKTGRKYRHIVGKTSITTLEPGKDLEDFDENNNILNRVLGIVIL